MLMVLLFWLIRYKCKIFLIKYTGIQLLLFFPSPCECNFIMEGENVVTLPGFSYALKNLLKMVK